MWQLEAPNQTARDTFLLCISRVRNPGLRARLRSIEDNIAAASDEFEDAAGAVTPVLHTLLRTNTVGGVVTADEMSDVYTHRMAKKGAPGRPIYDEILLSPAHARCPLCGQRTVSTLDHHLPKAEYPALAVAPVNLIPSCKDCNTIKLEAFPTSSEEETIHPYFDDIATDLWLHAEVLQTQPAALRFFVSPPSNWDATKAERMQNHFNTFHLADLYASHAATELIGMRYTLTIISNGGGPAAVQNHLAEIAAGKSAAFINSWQTAAYHALSNNHWFCNGGFAAT